VERTCVVGERCLGEGDEIHLREPNRAACFSASTVPRDLDRRESRARRS
jgi:hypothetical protein